jgi:EmrB/QacA subfamily drug resistance transporter
MAQVSGPPSSADPRGETAVLAATIAASAMAFIDGSIVPIALPAIQRDFQAELTTLQWVVNIYTLFLGALVLVGGAYGDSLGRRRIFLVGTALFVGSSALCGLAPSATVLVGARGLQGIGAALMVPQSLAIIAASFPEATRGRAIGTWSAASALTTALGPPAGGFLVDLFSWRAAFLINLPLGAVVLWLTLRRVPESRAERPQPVDLAGGILATASLALLTVALLDAPRLGLLSPRVALTLALAVALGAAFLIWESRTPHPMMPLSLFRSRVFSLVNVATLLLYGALSGVLFLLPYTLIGLRGYSALQAGAALLPLGILIGVLARGFGSLGDRIGTRLPMAVGSAVVAASMAWLAATRAADPYWIGVLGPVTGIALGMAGLIAPLTTTVMNAVSAERSGTASGINNAAARSAGLLAVAITVSLATAIFAAELSRRLPAVLPPPATEAVLSEAGRLLEIRWPEGTPADAKAVAAAAYERAFAWVMLLHAALAAAAALACLALPRGRDQPSAMPETSRQ